MREFPSLLEFDLWYKHILNVLYHDKWIINKKGKSIPVSSIKKMDYEIVLNAYKERYPNEENLCNRILFHFQYFNRETVEAGCINSSIYKRKKRLQDFIKLMIDNYKPIFITLNFKDATLESTSEDTRKQYVRKFLKKYCSMYVANIDYGSKNEREHYHAVVVPKTKIDFKDWHKFGCVYIEHIRQSSSEEKLSKYITKLSNHALKETNRKNLVIYSR